MDNDSTVKLHFLTDVPGSDPAPVNNDVRAIRRLIRQTELFDQLAVSKATGYRLIAAGKVGPKPIKLTSSTVRYDIDEVMAWFDARKPDGNLHDAKSWQPVWEAIKRKKGI